jgi:hypothetical protein
VRRAKLYYLRHLTGKATRIREKKSRISIPTTGVVAEPTPAESMPAVAQTTRAAEE